MKSCLVCCSRSSRLLIIIYVSVIVLPVFSKANGTWTQKPNLSVSVFQLDEQQSTYISEIEEAVENNFYDLINSNKPQFSLKRMSRSLEEFENVLKVCPSKNEIDDYRTNNRAKGEGLLERYFQTDPSSVRHVISVKNSEDCLPARYYEINTTTHFSVTVDDCCVNNCAQEIHFRTTSNAKIISKFMDFYTPGAIVFTSSGEMICNTEALDIVAVTRSNSGETQEYTVDWFCGFKQPGIEYVDQSNIKLVLTMRNDKECRDRINFNVIVVPCLESKTDVCHEHHNTLTHTGNVSTPGLVSHGQYFNNQDCQWSLSVPRGKFIQIYASTFELGDGDVLEILISNPNTNNSDIFPRSAVFSNEHPFTNTLVLPTNECIVKFSSDQKLPGKGFSLQYESVEENEFRPMYNNLPLDFSQTEKFPEFTKCNLFENCAKEGDELGCSYEHPDYCTKGFVFKNKCYQISLRKNPISWVDAETFCQTHYDGHLIALNTVPKRRFYDTVSKLFESNDIFLGLHRRNMVYAPILYRRLWKWTDGTTAFYLPKQLNHKSWESCAMFNGQVFFATDCSELKQNVTIVCENELKKTYGNGYFTDNGKSLSQSDKFDMFECQSGEFIAFDRKCDGNNDCFDRSDETGCFVTTIHKRVAKFTCNSSETVGFSFVCDGIDHCSDRSDEDFCREPEWSYEDEDQSNSYDCPGNKIKRDKFCNGIEDCLDNSDEESCLTCQGNTTLCPGLYCMPDSWLTDDEYDCPFPHWTVNRLIESDFNTSTSHHLEPPGIVTPDDYGKVTIQPMSIIDVCPATHFQCEDGFCIPFYLLCNGICDCPYGEDETLKNCKTSCHGNYKCMASRTCIPFVNVCDGHYNCPGKDDESLCESERQRQKFPHCEWVQRELTCTEVPSLYNETNAKSFHLSFGGLSSLEYIKFEQYTLISLNVSHNRIKRLSSKHIMYPNLVTLDLSKNSIDFLDDDVFQYCSNLQYLMLSSNNIVYLSLSLFANLTKLLELDLSDNPIDHIKSKQFSNAPNIIILDLKSKYIEEIHKDAFFGLERLRRLDLTGAPITEFSSNVFHDLNELEFLSSDNFRVCCSGVKPSHLSQKGICLASSDEISSCKDMLRLDFFRVSHWIMATLTILGNSAVIMYRIFWDKTKRLTFRIIITCLAVSDLLMGVYLVIIGVADSVYRQQFVLYENEWKESIFCQVAGYLCVLSSEASCLFILVATLDRVTAIAFPFHQHLHFSTHRTIVICTFTWLIGIVISSLPVIPPFKKWKLYSQIAVGIPLPITRSEFDGSEFAFGIFVILNMIIFMFVLLGQVLIWVSIKRRSKILNTHERTKQDLKVAKQLFLVVLTDCLCWFPVTVMGVMARHGVPIPGIMYVVTTVYLLPANSALNPFLYTIHAFIIRRKERVQTKVEQLDSGRT